MKNKEIEKLFKKCHFYNDMYSKYFYFTQSQEELGEMLKHIGVEHSFAGGCAIIDTDVNNIDRYFIGVFDNNKGSLAHECVHIASFLYERIGQKLSYDDENFCYLVGWLFEECEKKWISKLK